MMVEATRDERCLGVFTSFSRLGQSRSMLAQVDPDQKERCCRGSVWASC